MKRAKIYEGRFCPFCGSKDNQIRYGKNASGSQRCKCLNCNKTCTPESNLKEYPEETRNAAITAYYAGSSFRSVANQFGFNKGNVKNWLKKPDEVWLSPNTKYDVSEIDEIMWFTDVKHGKKRKYVKIILEISNNPRQIVDFRVTMGETVAAAQEMVNELPNFKLSRTDGGYVSVRYPGESIANLVDKSDTHHAESVNSDLRQYISELRRSSKCFYRSLETLRLVIAVFVDAYNKFGDAKMKYRTDPENIAQGKVFTKHVKDREGRKLHRFKDVPLSLFYFF